MLEQNVTIKAREALCNMTSDDQYFPLVDKQQNEALTAWVFNDRSAMPGNFTKWCGVIESQRTSEEVAAAISNNSTVDAMKLYGIIPASPSDFQGRGDLTCPLAQGALESGGSISVTE